MYFDSYKKVIQNTNLSTIKGRVTELTGLAIKATAAGVSVGELVEIHSSTSILPAEVIGFKGQEVILMPIGFPEGIGPDSEIIATGHSFEIECSEKLLGQVLNGLGSPISQPTPLYLIPWLACRKTTP